VGRGNEAGLTLTAAGDTGHGKTDLIRALGGEAASLRLPSGRRVGLNDPAGDSPAALIACASVSDGFLIAVAADQGVTPQAREAVEQLRALELSAGVLAVTKSDLADPAAALAQVVEFLPGVPAIAVCAASGAGCDELRELLDAILAPLADPPSREGAACLHVERAWSEDGAGTLVSGVLWSGEIAPGDELQLLPRELPVAVRGIQARADRRLTLELEGIRPRELALGDVLAGPAGELHATRFVDVALQFRNPDHEPETGDEVLVHHGTRQSVARVARLGGRFWQLRLAWPLIARRGDRLLLRDIASGTTLAGGEVLDPAVRKHGTSNEVIVRLTRLLRGEPPPAPEERRRGAPPPKPKEPLAESALQLERRLRAAWFEALPAQDINAADVEALRRARRAVQVAAELVYHPDALAEIERRAAGLAELTPAALQDELAIPRELADALHAHLGHVTIS
jgi:selenocysteine-specific elongation factor